MSDFTTTFDNESFINSEISNNENIKSSLNAEEVIENSLDVVEETASELNSQEGMNSLLDEPMVHRYNGEDSDNIEVHVDNEKYKISATLKQIRFKTSNDFPEVGSEKLIYIANDTKEIFGWDDSNGYFKIKVGETYDDSEIKAEIDLLKENKVDNAELDKYYTKSQVDDILASGSVDVDLSDYYKKSETYSQQEVNGLLNNKANKSELSAVDTRVSELEKDNATNKTNINNLNNTKADKTDVIDLQNNKADKSEIPFVGNFITKAVDDLVNYYTKEETYTQAEVRQLVSAIPKFSVEVVTGFPTNPSETTIYLLKTSETETRNLYTEYIFVNGIWEKLGTQTLDLSGYVTTEALNSELAKYYTIKNIDALLSYKADKTELPYVGDFITKYVEDLVNYYKKAETYTKEETASLLNGALSTKADKTELDAYVTDEELEAKGYLTGVPDEYITEEELREANYVTESELEAKLILKGYDDAIETLETSINQVSNNVTGISQKYVQDAVVSTDGKTLQIVKKVGNEIKNVFFQGGSYDDSELRGLINDKADKSDIPDVGLYAKTDASNLTVNNRISWRNLWWEGFGITLNKEDGVISASKDILMVPDVSKRISVSVTSSGMEYVAPSNGYLSCAKSGLSGRLHVVNGQPSYRDSAIGFSTYSNTTATGWIKTTCPCAKGDKLYIFVDNGVTDTVAWFTPVKES